MRTVTKCLIYLGFLVVAIPAVGAEGSSAPLQIKVITSGEGSLFADSTLIMGEKDSPLPGLIPSAPTLTSAVVPEDRSRTKTSGTWLVSLATRSSALLEKAT